MTISRRLAGPLLMTVLLAVGTTALAQQNSDSFRNNEGLLPGEANTVRVVNEAKPSVAAISVTVEGQEVQPLENMPPEVREFFKRFYGDRLQKQLPQRRPTRRSAGSGFVIARPGYILTNYHVIAAALDGETTELKENATIKVHFEPDNKLPAKVVGVLKTYDLALLQLKNPDDLPENADPLTLANSDDVQVGQKAIAIGNPFLLEASVTEGIVSAINREEPAKVSGAPIPFIQTDAAINRGSSGGPLLNSQGKVIGVNDAILAPHGAFVGVGLAIPSNIIRKNLDKLKEGGYIEKAMMGVAIQTLADYPEPIRDQLGLPDYGVMIVAVKEGSPADEAGLQGAEFTINYQGRPWAAGGDIILKANGMKLEDATTLQKIVFSKPEGTEVELLVLRNGEKKEITVTLRVLDDQDDSESSDQDEKRSADDSQSSG